MVELGCGRTTMKYILFVVNFIFFLLGAVTIGVGVWALVDKNKMHFLTKIGAGNSSFNVAGLLETAAIVLVASGIAILVIGFLGCYGAMRQSKTLLYVYAALLMVVLIIELAVIVIAVVSKGKVQDKMKAFLEKTIKSRYEGKIDTKDEFSLGIDYAQVYFQCCGIESWTDFEGATKWHHAASVKIPLTCCKLKDKDAFLKHQKLELQDPNCPTNPTQVNSNKNKACWDSIKSYLNARITMVIGLVAGVIVFEIVCVLFACCIINELRKGYAYA